MCTCAIGFFFDHTTFVVLLGEPGFCDKLNAMRRVFGLLLCLTSQGCQLPAQAPTPRPFRVVKLDPALDDIVSTDAKLETLGEHFGLTEGPVWVQEGRVGYLLFSDCAANVIYKWAPNAPLSVFLEKSGYTGTDVSNVGDQTVSGRLAILLIGSNGLALDAQGRLIITAMTDRNVTRLEKDGTRTVLADRYQGKRFSGPNDLAIKSDGSVYFTDSVFGMRGGAKSPSRELPYEGVFRIKDGVVTLLLTNEQNPADFPNGIVFSPDEKYLYLTAGFGKTLRWEVQPDGTIRNGKLFIPAGNDGMKVDKKGNLYAVNAVGPGEVWITSPEGKHLGTLELPQVTGEPKPRICATNLAFGDEDYKTLYITSCTHLFRVRLKAEGMR
jgi:gluconolactonase